MLLNFEELAVILCIQNVFISLQHFLQNLSCFCIHPLFIYITCLKETYIIGRIKVISTCDVDSTSAPHLHNGYIMDSASLENYACIYVHEVDRDQNGVLLET